MSTVKSMKPMKEEIIINKIITMKRQRPKPEIIDSEALKKSIEIISKYDYTLPNKEQNIEYKTCFLCKNEFPIIQGKKFSCENCGEIFCIKHRNVLNHHCIKLDPKLEKYLMAKNLFKDRIKMLKMKGH